MVEEESAEMRVLLGASLLVCGAWRAFGQPAAPAPAFDVASVKVDTAGLGEGPGRGRETITPSPGGVTMMNVHLKSVVQWAYHVQAIQVSGPGWMDNERYDIVAKAAGEASTERLRAMMQTLLAERFKLALHRETKEMPAYVVTVAKGGHKLKESQGDGDMEVKPNGRMGASFYRVTLAQLADLASSPLQGVVVDQTGLKGRYDFSLDLNGYLSGDGRAMGIEDGINLLIQAVNEQLGIKIDQKKAPAEVLIVDHAEKVPVEN
jgi:uncharacterized protein (TIGR03435 family)